jgi:hypothetical protein
MKRFVLVSIVCLTFAGGVLVGCRRHTEPGSRPRVEEEGQPFSTIAERGANLTGAVVANLQSPSDFKVTMSGIICHALLDPNAGSTSARRSFVLEGDAQSHMEHVAVLFVPLPALQAEVDALTSALRDATGHPPSCPDANAKNKCSVNISGVEVRIRGDADSLPVGGGVFTIEPSFECLPPHLQTVAPSATIPVAWRAADPPTPTTPVAASVEIDGGGTLASCPLQARAFFDNQNESACRQFSQKTIWRGATTGAAILELRTGADWKKIPVPNAAGLDVRITNFPPEPVPPSSAHFHLYEKLVSATLPKITGSCTPAHLCATCSRGEGSIPGCSDTQWP